MSAIPSAAQDPALALDHRTKMEILFAVLLALFLSALDQTVVGTALPRIVTDLGGNDLYTWVVTIYLLTSTITVPFYGKLSDQYGRKPLLLIGISLFLLGSALSGLSQNMAMLIAFRGLQGMGAGALFPIALAVIGDLFTPTERGRYQGLFGAVFGLSFILGPFIGGFLTDQISWHWVFYVNLPIGLAALFVIARLLPAIKRPKGALNFDWWGSVVFTVAISMILVGLTNKQNEDWSAPGVGGLLAAGGALAAIFLFIESRAREPIVPLELWRNRTYAASMSATFFSAMGFFGTIIFIPRWFQFVLGVSATESGYQSFALLIGLIGGSIVSGQLVSRTGRYKGILLVGLGTMTTGLFLLTHLEVGTAVPLLWLWMFITGVGIGPTMAVFTIAVQNAVPFSKLGVATSNLTFFRQIGGSVGLAIIGTLFGTTLVDAIPVRLAANGLPQALVDQFESAGGPGAAGNLVGVGTDLGTAILAQIPAQARQAVEPLIPNIVRAIHEAFTIAVADTFRLGIVATIIAFVAALAMHEIPLRHGHSGEPPLAG